MAEVIAMKSGNGSGRTIGYTGVRYSGGRRYETGREYDFDYVRNGQRGGGYSQRTQGQAAIAGSQNMRSSLARSSAAAARRQNPANNPVLRVRNIVRGNR